LVGTTHFAVINLKKGKEVFSKKSPELSWMKVRLVGHAVAATYLRGNSTHLRVYSFGEKLNAPFFDTVNIPLTKKEQFLENGEEENDNETKEKNDKEGKKSTEKSKKSKSEEKSKKKNLQVLVLPN